MTVAAIVMLLAAASASGSRQCSKPGEKLYRLSRASKVTTEVLERSRTIVGEFPAHCLGEQIVIKMGRDKAAVGSPTHLYGRICQRSSSPLAVKHYMEYRLDNWHSPDEELSLMLERIFVSKPAAVLSLIAEQHDTIKTQLLNDIAWGFLSNRVYGPEDPFEERSRQTYTSPEDLPRERLNIRTYKSIFFRLHEDMVKVARRYPQEINYILQEVRTFLETWGERR